MSWSDEGKQLACTIVNRVTETHSEINRLQISSPGRSTAWRIMPLTNRHDVNPFKMVKGAPFLPHSEPHATSAMGSGKYLKRDVLSGVVLFVSEEQPCFEQFRGSANSCRS